MDLSLKTIAEFDPVRMRAIERRTDDYSHGTGRVGGAAIRVQNLLLYDDLSARRIDQRFRHDESFPGISKTDCTQPRRACILQSAMLEDHKFFVDGQAKTIREYPFSHRVDMIPIRKESFDQFILFP